MPLSPEYLRSKDEATLASILQNVQKCSERRLNYYGFEISLRDVREARQTILEETRIDVELLMLRKLLDAYPEYKVLIAAHGVGDTEAREGLLDLMANHLLNTDWPTYGDNFPQELFFTHLHAQARKMGFTVK